jgi:hypothetical protein
MAFTSQYRAFKNKLAIEVKVITFAQLLEDDIDGRGEVSILFTSQRVLLSTSTALNNRQFIP